ncbi:T9SS type A sorting domain-containing protein [Kordia sp.]|uniref:T9SS type A sorting domain-containing protein n=1 Tax=Kordia sp. TaxID=1965332 RepID=UPI003D2CFD74
MNSKLLTALPILLCFLLNVNKSEAQNMYSLAGWNVGTGNITDFSQYGATSSNIRELGYNHIGDEEVLWKAIPNPSSNGEGGIYGAYKSIDKTKTYRLSIWIKKTNSADGRTYFGCHSKVGSTHYTLNLDGTANSNPYFWYGDLPKLDHWYLLTGYVHKYNYSGPILGKIYDGVTGEVVANLQKEFKFSSGATNLMLRSFLYNDPNLQDRQYLYDPHLELVDGTESTLEQLLMVNPNSKLLFVYDNAGNQKQRFYCAFASCTVPTPPAGRVASEEVVAIKKSEEIEDDNIIVEKELSLYPNPTRGLVLLKFNSNSDVSLAHDINVYNSLGILVKTIPSNAKNELEIDLANLSSGMYLVHIHLSNNTSITKQIIKK